MSVNFKLTQDNGLTRRVGFPQKPDWFTLASKIELLFTIPASDAAVSYLDSDGDQVTLSTPEELDDYYSTIHTAGDLIKFSVKDLAAIRNKFTANVESFGIARTPPTSMSVPPGHSDGPSFNGDLFEKFAGPQGFPDIVEEDWQDVHFNSFNPHNQMFHGGTPMGRASTPPHIEVVETTSSASKLPSQFSEPVLDDAVSVVSSIVPTYTANEKGKGKNPFAASVVDEEDTHDSLIEIVDTTPRQNEQALEAQHGYMSAEAPQGFGSISDAQEEQSAAPLDDKSIKDETAGGLLPMPEDSLVASPPSLMGDISIFIGQLTEAFASHPELSEGLRNIVRTLGDGQYWSSERQQFVGAVKQTVDAISVEGKNIAASVNTAVAEDQAGKRVAEVIGGIFGVLSEAFSSLSTSSGAFNSRAQASGGVHTTNIVSGGSPQPESAQGNPYTPVGPTVAADMNLSNGEETFADMPSTSPPDSVLQPIVPPTVSVASRALPQPNQRGIHATRPSSMFEPSIITDHLATDGTSTVLDKMLAELSLVEVHTLMADNGLSGRTMDSLTASEKIKLTKAAGIQYPQLWAKHAAIGGNPGLDTYARALGSRARLEEAKAKYKEEKALFRAVKEQVRLEKENRESRKIATPSNLWLASERSLLASQPTAVPTPQAVGGRSTIEAAVNRSNTWSGGIGGPRYRHRVDHINSVGALREAATFQSILSRLDDMGFNDSTNTTIRQVVESHMSSQGAIGSRVTKEKEDELVASVLDDLINAPPTSGPSGLPRNRNATSMPGEFF